MSEIFPGGKFLTRAKQWALTETKAGDPQVFIAFADVGDLGQPPAYFGGFGEKSLSHTMKALRACGWQGHDVLELERADCGLDRNQVELVVEHEQYEGKPRAKAKWINVPGAGVTPLSAEKKASFAQQMKARILQLEQGQPRPAQQQQRQDGPPPGHPANNTDVDIPF